MKAARKDIPPISVIVCTFNPKADLLTRCLGAIGAQSLAFDDFELIVVFNNTDPVLEEQEISRLAACPVRIYQERRQGLVYARMAGIAKARAPLYVFVDDDNELGKDYLENALSISQFRAEPWNFRRAV